MEVEQTMAAEKENQIAKAALKISTKSTKESQRIEAINNYTVKN